MADFAAPRRRSACVSITGASSPAVADGHYAASPSRRESSTPGSAGYERAASDSTTPLQFQLDVESHSGKYSSSVGRATREKAVPDIGTPYNLPTSIVLPDRTHSNRQSAASIKSNSSTGSSIATDSSSNSTVSSPFCDWPSTSPEEDSAPIPSKAASSKRLPRPKPRRTDNQVLEPLEPESPVVAAEKRKKASRKYRVTPTLPIQGTRPSTRLEPPVTERRRSSSAPGKPSSTESGQTSEDLVSWSIHHDLIPGIQNLTLESRDDATISPKPTRASSGALAKLANEQRDRPSSALGRVEKGFTEGARTMTAATGLDNVPREVMDWKPTFSMQWPKPGEALQHNSPSNLSTAELERLDAADTVPDDSSTSSESGHMPATRVPPGSSDTLLLLQQGAAENDSPATKKGTPGESLPREVEPVEIIQDDIGSGVNELLENNNLDDGESNNHTVPEASSTTGTDQMPEPEVVSDTDGSVADEEEDRHPVIERFHDDIWNMSQIQMKLINIIKRKADKGKAPPTKVARGYIYVHTYKAWRKKSGTGSGHTYRYFKVGWAHKQDPNDRQKQQKDCIPNMVHIGGKKQREFAFSGYVDELIKHELREHRRKFVCRKCKNAGKAVVHGEIYKIDEGHLLEVIEKWRAWVTENKPYNSRGALRPRWNWKLALLDKGKDGVHLDHILQPFTSAEKRSRQWEWISDAWNGHFDQYEHNFRAVMDLTLAIGLAWAIFVYWLGSQLGSTVFVASSVLALEYLSWR